MAATLRAIADAMSKTSPGSFLWPAIHGTHPSGHPPAHWIALEHLAAGDYGSATTQCSPRLPALVDGMPTSLSSYFSPWRMPVRLHGMMSAKGSQTTPKQGGPTATEAPPT
jgi:hypothetical protein